jgi:hypothetical protein
MGIELIPRNRRLRSKMTPVSFRGPLRFESGFHFLVHSWFDICSLGLRSATLVAIRAA